MTMQSSEQRRGVGALRSHIPAAYKKINITLAHRRIAHYTSGDTSNDRGWQQITMSVCVFGDLKEVSWRLERGVLVLQLLTIKVQHAIKCENQ